MNSVVTEKDKSKPFPKLMKSDDNGTIILFSESKKVGYLPEKPLKSSSGAYFNQLRGRVKSQGEFANSPLLHQLTLNQGVRCSRNQTLPR